MKYYAIKDRNGQIRTYSFATTKEESIRTVVVRMDMSWSMLKSIGFKLAELEVKEIV